MMPSASSAAGLRAGHVGLRADGGATEPQAKYEPAGGNRTGTIGKLVMLPHTRPKPARRPAAANNGWPH